MLIPPVLEAHLSHIGRLPPPQAADLILFECCGASCGTPLLSESTLMSSDSIYLIILVPPRVEQWPWMQLYHP